MDLIPEDARKLYGNGRYDSFPIAASARNVVLAAWRSASEHEVDHAAVIRGAISLDGGQNFSDSFVLYDDKDALVEPGLAGLAWDEKRQRWTALLLIKRFADATTRKTSQLRAAVITSPLLASAASWSKPGAELPVTSASWFFACDFAISGDRWVAVGYGRMTSTSQVTPMTMTSTDGGASWSAPVVPAGMPDGLDFTEASILRTSDGAWLMAMREDTTTSIHISRSSDGVAWTYDQAVIGGFSGYPELGQAGDGTLVMLLRDGANGPDQYHGSWAWAWSQDGGESWSVRTDFPSDGKAMMYGALTPAPDGALVCVFSTEDDPAQPWKSASVYWTRFVVNALTGVIEWLPVSPGVAVPRVTIGGAGRLRVDRTIIDEWSGEQVVEGVRFPSDTQQGVWWDYELPQGVSATYSTGPRSTGVITAPTLPGPMLIHPTQPELSLRIDVIEDDSRDLPIDADVTAVPAPAGSDERPQYPIVSTSGMLGSYVGSTKIRTRTLNEERRLRQCVAGLSPLFFSHHRGMGFPPWIRITALTWDRFMQQCTDPLASWDDDDDKSQWRTWTIKWVEQDRPSPTMLRPHRRIRDVPRPFDSIAATIEDS